MGKGLNCIDQSLLNIPEMLLFSLSSNTFEGANDKKVLPSPEGTTSL